MRTLFEVTVIAASTCKLPVEKDGVSLFLLPSILYFGTLLSRSQPPTITVSPTPALIPSQSPNKRAKITLRREHPSSRDTGCLCSPPPPLTLPGGAKATFGCYCQLSTGRSPALGPQTTHLDKDSSKAGDKAYQPAPLLLSSGAPQSDHYILK